MKITHDLMIILEPEEGCLLTDGNTYTDKVFLGINASPDNWHDIRLEEVPENERVFGQADLFNESVV